MVTRRPADAGYLFAWRRSVQASVILAHPYPRSFNHALFARVLEVLEGCGIPAWGHDLYAERFDPVLTAEELGKEDTRDSLTRQYTRELVASDVLVFIHPNWWGQPPAMMKGYIDRVIRPPHAYDFPEGDSGGGLPVGRLAGKIGIVLNTSNTPADREDGFFGDPLESIWKRCVFGFCGMEEGERVMFRVVADSTAEQRAVWLEQAATLVQAAAKRLA
jgi:NAD(P)H dehydrogenase (quinone)